MFASQHPCQAINIRHSPFWAVGWESSNGSGGKQSHGAGGRERSPFLTWQHWGGGCRARVGWLFPWGNAGAGHGGHRSGKWDPTSGVAVPAGTSGGKAEEFPKGPWRQRGGCQEGMKGSADGSRGSLPGWHGHCGDTPPPSAPSAWRSKVGGGGQAQRTPLHPDILPQISPSHSQEKRSQR